MIQRYINLPFALVTLALWPGTAPAGMGPCMPGDFGLICGSGSGAARAIVKTISPSKRLAFAWRLADRPPTDPPKKDATSLQNMIVRLEDGLVLATSQGSYWDLSTKIAKAYLMISWSPDSRLLVKVEQRAEYASAEVFAFADDDAAIGPFDLVKAIEPAVRDKVDAKDVTNSTLVFAAHPAMTISDQGLFRAVVYTRGEDVTDSPPYDVTVQVTRSADSLRASVLSVAPRSGASVSIIVY